MASVMAAVISRFCSSVRPAYHCTVMLGIGAPSYLPEALHVLGKVRGERVGLDGAIGAEANGEVLGHFGAGGASAEEPAPRRVAAVQAHLVGLAEHALERHLVRPAYGDRARLGRRELAAERYREAPDRQGDDGKESHHAWRAHTSIITRAIESGQRRRLKKAQLLRWRPALRIERRPLAVARRELG